MVVVVVVMMAVVVVIMMTMMTMMTMMMMILSKSELCPSFCSFPSSIPCSYLSSVRFEAL